MAYPSASEAVFPLVYVVVVCVDVVHHGLRGSVQVLPDLPHTAPLASLCFPLYDFSMLKVPDPFSLSVSVVRDLSISDISSQSELGEEIVCLFLMPREIVKSSDSYRSSRIYHDKRIRRRIHKNGRLNVTVNILEIVRQTEFPTRLLD